MTDTHSINAGNESACQPPAPDRAVIERPGDEPKRGQRLRAFALRYGIALLVFLLATLIRFALQPMLKETLPFAFYFCGVIVVAWHAGSGPALLTVALGAVAGFYYFVPPMHSFHLKRFDTPPTLVGYCLISSVLAAIIDVQRTARNRTEQARIEAVREIARREKVEEALRRQQAEIEVLNARLQRAMAETHHRVKNNLQVITSIVDVQIDGAGATVPTDALRRIGQHVLALAAIHDLLTREVKNGRDADSLNVREILGQLGPMLEKLAGERPIRFTIEDLRLPTRQGIGLAVLINELVSNAIKHGAGGIEIALAVVEDRIDLSVRDEGSGFPAGFDPRRSAHTGLELIESVSQWDLGGKVSFQNHPEGGAWITVAVPVGYTTGHGIREPSS